MNIAAGLTLARSVSRAKPRQYTGGPEKDAMPHTSHTTLIGTLAESLTRANYRLATAESCTGGLIAALCTDVAGSSAWFSGGIVAYANEVKQHLLGVSEATLRQHGAVSEAVVRQMALGVLVPCGAQASVAVSGVAGPGGGTPEKPVGTVWTAIAVVETAGTCTFADAALDKQFPNWTWEPIGHTTAVVWAWRHQHTGNRATVRQKTAEHALAALDTLLRERVTGRDLI